MAKKNSKKMAIKDKTTKRDVPYGRALIGALILAKKFDAYEEGHIGIMIPTTGGTATDGKDMESAIKLAADEINAAGGLLGKKIVAGRVPTGTLKTRESTSTRLSLTTRPENMKP